MIDEIRIVVVPIVLGEGKALFKDVKERHALKFHEAKPLKSGLVRLTYSNVTVGTSQFLATSRASATMAAELLVPRPR